MAAETAGFNTAAERRPAVVVGAASAEDVAAAVRFAAAHDLPVGVLATGHGGVGCDGGVLVTTRRMQQVRVDPQRRLAQVGAGVRWEKVIGAASEHGLAPLNGSTPDAGVAGYTLGGGVPVLGRTFGFAADHVRNVQMVTADGVIREVDRDHEPDLFWALRGGKGNFGVVTAMEFDLMPVARLYGGGIYYAGEHAPAVLHAYRDWVTTLPEAMTTSVALLRLPDLPEVPAPLRGRCAVHLRVAHVGAAADGERLVAPMRAAAPAFIDAVADMPYTAVGSIHNDPADPLPMRDRGCLLRELTAETVEAVLSAAGPQHPDLPLIVVEIRHLGGAMARQPDPPNCAGGRDAAFAALVVGAFPPPLRDIVPHLSATVLSALAPWSTGGTHANFGGVPDGAAEAARAWTAQAYQRLLAIKQSYDPANLFGAGCAIQPHR
jgi:FAD/FMN-containing dehydrogenase